VGNSPASFTSELRAAFRSPRKHRGRGPALPPTLPVSVPVVRGTMGLVPIAGGIKRHRQKTEKTIMLHIHPAYAHRAALLALEPRPAARWPMAGGEAAEPYAQLNHIDPCPASASAGLLYSHSGTSRAGPR